MLKSLYQKTKAQSKESNLSDGENSIANAALLSKPMQYPGLVKRHSIINKATNEPITQPSNSKFSNRSGGLNNSHPSQNKVKNEGGTLNLPVESDRSEFQTPAYITKPSSDTVILEKQAKSKYLDHKEQERLKRIKLETRQLSNEYQSDLPPQYPASLKNAQYPRIEMFFSCKNFAQNNIKDEFFLKISSEGQNITSEKMKPI